MAVQAAPRDGTPLWVGLLTVASIITTLALACATPFASLAAIAATRMPARAGYALIALTWLASQVIGFCMLDYPRDALTITWGGAILTAALVALAAARRGAHAVEGPAMQLATAFGTGFLGFKATLLAWSLMLGGVHTALSPYWTAIQFGREALILVALVAIYHLAVALGVPTMRRSLIASI